MTVNLDPLPTRLTALLVSSMPFNWVLNLEATRSLITKNCPPVADNEEGAVRLRRWLRYYPYRLWRFGHPRPEPLREPKASLTELMRSYITSQAGRRQSTMELAMET